MNFKKLAFVTGISLSLFTGCSKKEEVLYKETIDLGGTKYIVEVRSLGNGPGRRLWIYNQEVERIPNTTSEWAGVSFALDEDGNGGIDSLKGPISGYYISIEGTSPSFDRERSKEVYNKLEDVLKHQN